MTVARSIGAVSAAVCLTVLLTAHDQVTAPHGGKPPLHAQETMHAFSNHHEENEPQAASSIQSCVGGFAGVYPCSNVDLMAFLPLNQLGGGSGNDIWGWTDPTTDKEYAIMGRTTGTAFVDISDPVNPVYLGNLPAHGSGSTWRDIKVYQNHAFIGSEEPASGMQVFDLTQLRSVASPPVQFAETAHHNGFSSSHNLAINEDSGFAYAVGGNTCAGGLDIVDIQNPTNPTAAGCFSADGYTHDAQCVNYQGPDADYAASEICFNYNVDTLTIVDVTNKAAPIQVSRTGYQGSEYSHQGWVTEDHRYLLMDDELDESRNGVNTTTLIWDVANLDNPVLIGTYVASTPAIDHNQYVKGGYAYQGNYRAGLRILDISDIANANLAEVGFFDIYPSDDAPQFNGAWSVFPYYASGVVVIAGREQGLFVVKPNLGSPTPPPVVTFANPLEGDNLSGIETIQIDASDDDPVGTLDVEWNVDGGSWQTAPFNLDNGFYEASWDTAQTGNGGAVVRARAIDSSLREGSDRVNVTIFNPGMVFHVSSVVVESVAHRGPRNRGVAQVSVVDGSGAPVEGVIISGSFSGDSSSSVSGATSSTGVVVFETPPIKGGTTWNFCVDSAAKNGWTHDEPASVLCGSTGGSAGFGSISGVIADASSSAAVAGASVSVDSGQATSTDAGGGYTLNSVPAGNRTVTVTASGYDAAVESVGVADGVDSPLNIELSPATSGGFGTIKGTVLGSGGDKLGGVLVTTDTGHSATTNKGGKYTIQNVPEGDRTVTASKAGYSDASLPATVAAGSTTTVNFSLSP